ncbi:hypothetical protein LTR33_007838 [Friedmanniomyces endolithicus]|nr:hypothetical protein LTR33_007838 [Friedmanniomyces endolithicus]
MSLHPSAIKRSSLAAAAANSARASSTNTDSQSLKYVNSWDAATNINSRLRSQQRRHQQTLHPPTPPKHLRPQILPPPPHEPSGRKIGVKMQLDQPRVPLEHGEAVHHVAAVETYGAEDEARAGADEEGERAGAEQGGAEAGAG